MDQTCWGKADWVRLFVWLAHDDGRAETSESQIQYRSTYRLEVAWTNFYPRSAGTAKQNLPPLDHCLNVTLYKFGLPWTVT
jgi:hypothetical protein